MKCTRLTQFKPQGQYLPCGQCMPCRITRRLEWQTKLTLEFMESNQGVFITLTYSPENLPFGEDFEGGNLEKTHLQKFIKRFRRNYQYKYGETEIRYFAVGEYGEKSHRAHFHIMIFHLDSFRSEEILKKSWTLGHSQIDRIIPERIKYIVGYTIKKMTHCESFPDGQQPEFNLMSKNPALGSRALDKFQSHLDNRNVKSTSHLTQLQKFHLETEQFFTHKDFNGWFKHKGKWLKLDRPMMAKLGHKQLPKYDNLAESIDSRYTLLPKRFRIHEDIRHDNSKIRMLKSMLNGDQHETQKKADKQTRQLNKIQTRKV